MPIVHLTAADRKAAEWAKKEKAFYELIVGRLAVKDITHKQMAALLDVHVNTMHAYIQHPSDMRIKHFRPFAEALQLTTEERLILL